MNGCAVYDYEYTNMDGCVFNKIVFVMWTPDCSPLKHKMLYASTKGACTLLMEVDVWGRYKGVHV